MLEEFGLLDKIPIAIGISNSEGKIIYINQQHISLFGYSLKDIPTIEKWDIQAFPDENYRNEVTKIRNNSLLEHLNKKGSTPPKLYNITCKNGTVKKIEVTFNISEELIYVYFNDETELYRVNESLHREINFTHNLINGLPGIFYLYKKEDNIFKLRLWNKNLEVITGYNKNELSDTGVFTLLRPESSNLATEVIDKLMNKGVIEGEMQLLLKNGNTRPFYYTSYAYNNENEIYFLGTAVDVSKIKETHEALEMNRLFVKKITEQSPNFIYIYDINANENIYINRDLGRYLGYNDDEVPGNSHDFFDMIIHPDDLLKFKNLYKTLDEWTPDSVHEFEYRMKSKNGEWRWFYGKEKEFERKNGEISSLYGTVSDITESKKILTNLKLAEKELRENEKVLKNKNEEYIALNEELKQSYEEIKSTNEALQNARLKAQESDALKSAFLQNMSHEIRTPLNGILGFINLLTDSETTSEQREYYAQIINESSSQLMSIVDDIISMSKIETGQLELIQSVVHPQNLILDLFEAYQLKAEEKSIKLALSPECVNHDFSLITDEGKLWQTLNNLINNSIKFSEKGKIEVGFKIEEKKIKFWVRDTGIGIAEENTQKIFERFRQIELALSRTYGGTGLGLTIAKANVELLGGNIWVESELGKGSTFYFYITYLPVQLAKQAIKSEFAPNSNIQGNHHTFLVAEDETINYLYLEEILKENNANVIIAKNGKEAIDKFLLNSKIDLILLDIKMPEMDGYQVLEIIKLHNQDIPVIAQTAYASISDQQKAMNAGFDGYISKPIKKKELLELVNSLLKKDLNIS